LISAACGLESIVPTTAIEGRLLVQNWHQGRNGNASEAPCTGLGDRCDDTDRVHDGEAADGLYVPLLTYRTGPFAGSGIPYANGLTDYLNMLNQRDGGIGGIKLIIEECETGYDTKKGVECYDSVKGKNPVVVTPLSTGVTLQLIPKAVVDKIPIFSMAYGLSASADGNLLRLPSRRTAP
jgi:hypothetical protein